MPAEGRAATRQRVTAAVGRPRSAEASAALRQRRNRKAVTPELSAASCKRRPATIGRRPISPTTRGETRGAPGAQAFLDRPQDVVVALRRGDHEAGGVEPVLGEPRPVHIGPLQAPQDCTLTRLRAPPVGTLSRNAGESGPTPLGRGE